MRRFALSLLALGFALLAAEGLVRLSGAAPEVGWVRIGRFRLADNPKIGFEPIPARFASETSNDLIDFAGASNRFGFRDRDHAVEKPPGVFRIVVLGDSVGVGLKVARYEDTFPAILEANLQRRGLNAEVINLSVTGYNTQQEVETLAEKGLRFSPDLVLVAYTLSDRERLDGNIMETLLSAARLGRMRIERPANPRLVRSALYRLFYARILSRQSHEKAQAESERALAAISGDTVRASFAKLQNLGEEHRFQVMVAIFPYFVNLTQGYEYQAEHASAARDATDHGFEVVDLLASMQNCRKKAGRRIQVDSFHPNEVGHRCAAATIGRAILSGVRHSGDLPPVDLAREPPPPSQGSNGRSRHS